MTTRLYSLVPDADRARVLLLPSAAGWTLPQHAESDPQAIRRAAREQLGLDATVLGSVDDTLDDEQEIVAQVVALDPRDAAWEPPAGSHWAGQADLPALELAVPEHRAVIAAWLAEQAGGHIPPGRAPWSQPGWYDAAAGWAGRHLGERGERLDGPFEQLRVGATSCVLRATTAAGVRYVKATLGWCGFEARLTAELAELFPDQLPPVLASDAERVWLLLGDAGQQLRQLTRAEGSLDRWQAMLPHYARLQQRSAEHIGRRQPG